MEIEAGREFVAAPIQDTLRLHKWSGFRVRIEDIKHIERHVEEFEVDSVVRINGIDRFVDVPFLSGMYRGVLVDYGNKDAFTVIGIKDVGKRGFFFRAGWFSPEGIEKIACHLQRKVEMAVGGNPEELEKFRSGWEEKGFKILEPPAFPEGTKVAVAVVRRKIATGLSGRDFVPGFYYTYGSENNDFSVS